MQDETPRGLIYSANEVLRTGKTNVAIGILVVLIFLIKLGDSSYVREHGDAMGYHLYAPLLWARYGWDYVSGFQVMQYQSGLWEMFLSVLFRIWSHEAFEQRFFTHVVLQVFSCAVAFLFVPWLIWTKTKLSFLGRWVLFFVYIGAEIMTWSSQLAKNDSLAMALFVWGFLQPKRSWSQILLLGLAVGVKPTYLYGAFVVALLNFDKQHILTFVRQGLILLGPLPTWTRSYINTGNPFFPLPSERGLQTSVWQKEYFREYAQGGFGLEHFLKFKFFLKAPTMGLLLVMFLLWLLNSLRKGNFKQMGWEKMVIVFLPMVYFFITGQSLESRTYAGLFLCSAICMVTCLQAELQRRRMFVGVLFCVLGIATSKIDPSSWNRFMAARGKTYDQLVNYGRILKAANQISDSSDLILTKYTNEGWYLKAPILTINEHQRREELLASFPVLMDYQNFLLIHPKGCDWRGKAETLVNKLLENAQGIKAVEQTKGLYVMDLNCEGTT